MKKIYNKFIDGLGFLSSILLTVVSLFVFANVICRLLGLSVAWLFDTCIICCIFMTYLGFAFVQRDKGHMSLDMVTSKLNPGHKALPDLFISLVAIAFAIFNTYMVGVWFARVKANGLRATLSWNMPMWIFAAVMIFGWVVFMLVSGVQVVQEVKTAAKTNNAKSVLTFVLAIVIMAVIAVVCFKIHIVLGMFVLLLLLLFLGVPVALSLGAVAAVAMYIALGIIKGEAQFAILAFQGLNTVGITAAPLFILGGSLMFESGCIEGIYRLLDGSLGRKIPGASLVVTALTGLVFCAITGSTVAAHAVLAMLCMPIMRKRGYPDELSCGMIGGAAVGTLVPPSNSFILIGLLTGLPIANIFMAGTIPAFILFAGYIIYAIVWAKRTGFQEIRSVGDDMEKTPEQKKEDRLLGFLGILAPVICLGGMYGGFFTATEGGGILVAYSLIVGLFVTKKLTLKKVKETMLSSTRSSLTILFLLACAHTYSGVLTQTGITALATNFVLSLNLTKNMFLVIYTILLLIIGMFLNASSITLILYPITIPIYQALGIDPYFFAVYFTLLCELGALTPPVGVNIYIIQGSAPGLTATKVVKGCLPIIGIMLLVTIIIWVCPWLCTCLFA